MKVILKKTYDWNSYIDISEDIDQALNETDLPGEFEGELILTLEYKKAEK